MSLGYRKLGAGPNRVIALHGWFGDENTYQPMQRALTLDEFTYVFPAYRGYGASRHLTGAYTIEEISRDVLELADQLGWRQFSLVGHSMGGLAIQRIAADASGRVKKMVAVTPVPASGAPFDEQTWQVFASAPGDIDRLRALTRFSTGARHSEAWVDAIARNPLDNAVTAAFAGYLPSWAKANIVEMIRGNPTPVKVIVGRHDNALTPQLMTETFLAWYPNASLEVLEDAGHYPMDETPVALATSIEHFLRA